MTVNKEAPKWQCKLWAEALVGGGGGGGQETDLAPHQSTTTS